jgi:serine/threonine-protein kinase
MLTEGKQIGGYTLIRKIGKGGFGEVWLAERRTELVTTQVALKFSLDENIDLATVKNEAAVWAQASGHPNVLPIIEANIYDGHVAIVSEYAPDGSLEELLRQKGGLPIRRAVEMTVGILSGLQFLHTKQIVHRDVKPANVLLQGETPRLTDFGVSRLVKHTASLSQTIAGTPKYMAPEAFDGKRTPQTDIWAVGVMLYQMVTGQLPYPQEDTTELIGAIVLKQPSALPDFVPPQLKNILARALAKDPAQRYQTCDQMRHELSQFLITAVNIATGAPANLATSPQQLGQATPAQHYQPTAPIPPPATPQTLNSQATAVLPPQTQKSNKGLFIVAGIFGAFLLLLGGAGVFGYVVFQNMASLEDTPPYTPPPADTAIPGATSTPWVIEGPVTIKNPNYDDTEAAPYASAAKMREIIAAMETEAGGRVKFTDFNMYPGYVIAKLRDPKNGDNYDEYTYRDGGVEKEPIKVMIASDRDSAKLFSADDVNWEAIPELVKQAEVKAADLEGAEKPYVFLNRPLPFSKNINIRVYISGTRKDLRMEADAQGKVKELKIE